MDTEATETESSTHPDLSEEQAYLDRAYECLEDMRQQTARGARIVVAGDPYAEEAIYQMFLSRLADLSEETALCFGRIDRVDGDLYYIGRRHVHDENMDPVVIDWRAPIGRESADEAVLSTRARVVARPSLQSFSWGQVAVVKRTSVRLPGLPEFATAKRGASS